MREECPSASPPKSRSRLIIRGCFIFIIIIILINLFIYLFYFLAALGLCCCAWAFFVAVRGLLIAVTSSVAEHRL